MPRIAGLILLWLAGVVAAAEPTTPKSAVDALAITGAVAIAPEQVREALTGIPAIRKLARKGTTLEDLATAAAPLVELGYRCSGFAEAQVSAAGPALTIHEGPRRTWGDLVIAAPTPETKALARALISAPTARDTGLPIPAEQDPANTDEPAWTAGKAAHFEPGFASCLGTRLERGWAARGRPKPTVAVSVEPVGADVARCVVTITEPAPAAIASLQVDGAVANPAQDILAWLDLHAGIRVGSPADPALLRLGCAKLTDTGRFVSATATVGAGNAVTIKVREHPKLPLLQAKLTDWQQRWLDLGQQMQVLYETGPGIVISARSSGLGLSASVRLSRSQGVTLRLGSARDGTPAWELLLLKDRCRMTRAGQTPISCRLDQGGPQGMFGILPDEDPKKTLAITAQLSFNNQRSTGMLWHCAPAAMLATAGRAWKEDPAKPGTWIQVDEPGTESSTGRFRVTWDDQRRWRSWDLSADGADGADGDGIRFSPAEPEPLPASGPDLSGIDFLRATLREPAAWLQPYASQAWADLPLGLAAGICTPASVLWPTSAPEDANRLEFGIPQAEDNAGVQPSMAQFGAMLGRAADTLGTAIGPRAWPTLICVGTGAVLEDDNDGANAIARELWNSPDMGPLAHLLLARLLQDARSPVATQIAARGLTRCRPELAWADITACAGSEDLLLRWILAIDRVDDAVRLLPVAVRASVATDLNTIRFVAPAEQKALLAAAFQRWWTDGLGHVVQAELERMSKPEAKPADGSDIP